MDTEAINKLKELTQIVIHSFKISSLKYINNTLPTLVICLIKLNEYLL